MLIFEGEHGKPVEQISTHLSYPRGKKTRPKIQDLGPPNRCHACHRTAEVSLDLQPSFWALIGETLVICCLWGIVILYYISNSMGIRIPEPEPIRISWNIIKAHLASERCFFNADEKIIDKLSSGNKSLWHEAWNTRLIMALPSFMAFSIQIHSSQISP